MTLREEFDDILRSLDLNGHNEGIDALELNDEILHETIEACYVEAFLSDGDDLASLTRAKISWMMYWFFLIGREHQRRGFTLPQQSNE